MTASAHVGATQTSRLRHPRTHFRAEPPPIPGNAADLIADSPEVEPVNVRVLRPERTLVEKLILLHTAHSLNNEHDALRGARHYYYYDVHRLLTQR